MTRPEQFEGERLPSFIPSVSSVKDDRPFEDYLTLFESLLVPCALTSAYDWHSLAGDARDRAMRSYFDWRAAGGRMVLDSGRYEAYWRRDGGWSHAAYLRTALELTPTWIMSFDGPLSADAGTEGMAALREWERDQAAVGITPVVPIVHGRPESLPTAVVDVARESPVGLIAVAERDLGQGIVARARTVHSIRQALDDGGFVRALHLLGTGSPISVLIYSLAGADSFDGLEWNRTSTDFETARLYHFHHFDFFEYQSVAGGSGSYWARVLAHNLIFWQRWLDQIRRGDSQAMLDRYLPSAAVDPLWKALPEALQ